MKRGLSGIGQLQWALSFLKGITNSRGEYPKDVAICIQAVEDELVSGYAQMVEGVKPSKVGTKQAEKSKAGGTMSKTDAPKEVSLVCYQMTKVACTQPSTVNLSARILKCIYLTIAIKTQQRKYLLRIRDSTFPHVPVCPAVECVPTTLHLWSSGRS